MRELEPTSNERLFVLQGLAEGIRIDSRPLDALRDLNIKFGDESGVADVNLGLTRVVARVSAEVTKPLQDRKFNGMFTINTELSPIASPFFDLGRHTDLEALISRFLEKAIRRSNALDTESLCILAGQKCWHIRVDVHILDHDGGLIDTSCIAVVAALQHFRRPEISIDGERVTIHSVQDRVPVPLAMPHHPYCITLSFYHNGTTAVVDARLQEQQVSEGEMMVTANQHGEVCQVAKLGGVPTDALMLLECIGKVVDKVIEVNRKVVEALDHDAKLRNTDELWSEMKAENER